LKNIGNEIYYLIHLISSLSSLIDDDEKGKRGKKNCKESKKGRKNYESDIEMDDEIFDGNRYTASEEEIEF